MHDLVEAYSTTARSTDQVELTISISVPRSQPQRVSEFTVKVSPAQAALYVYISQLGKIKILPSASFGSVKHVEEMCQFFHSMMDPGVLKSNLIKANEDVKRAYLGQDHGLADQPLVEAAQ